MRKGREASPHGPAPARSTGAFPGSVTGRTIIADMTGRDRIKLLFGPYRPPAVRRGERMFCFYRDRDVIVTGWSHGRIPWPRGRAVDAKGGKPSLLVDEELARAVRSESVIALRHW